MGLSQVDPQATAVSTLYTLPVIIGGESGGAIMADKIVLSRHTAVLYLIRHNYGGRESFARNKERRTRKRDFRHPQLPCVNDSFWL